MKKIKCFVCIFLMVIFFTVPVSAERTNRFNYAWAPGGMMTVDTVPGFQIARVIDDSWLPIPLDRVDDVTVGGGRVFIADSSTGRVNVLDAEDYSFVTSIRLIRDQDNRIVVLPETNEQLMLDSPEGVFFSETLNRLYIADTGAERIVILEGDTLQLIDIITRPDNMVGHTAFRPARLAVDAGGRITFMVSGSFEGLVQLEADGSFSRYFGTTRPTMSPVDYFWRSIATQEQRRQMARVFAPSFTDVDIDPDGFIFAVTADSASTDLVFRFNARGDNVIRSEGNGFSETFMGNIPITGTSQFNGIAVTDFGVYALLDRNFGRIWVHDFDGYTLTIFGQMGDSKGDLQDPSSIAWNGYDILVGDRSRGVLNVFTPTRFGQAALLANQAYHEGRWEDANNLFREAVALNATFTSAYSGIGRNFLMQRQYAEALYYFRLAVDLDGYSRAWQGRRAQLIEQWFPLIAVVVVVFAVLIVYSEARYIKKQRYQDGEIETVKPRRRFWGRKTA